MKKSIKKFTVCCMVAISLLTFIGCTNKEEKELSALDNIKKSGKIVLGTSASYPPYEFHKVVDGKDEIVGFDIEIAEAIADELGVELEIKDMDFKGLIPALKTGKIDLIIAGMTPTEERKKEIDFSTIYYKAVQTLLTKEDAQFDTSDLEGFYGKKIGVQKSSIQEEIAADKIEDANLNSLSKVSDLVLSLKSDKVDAVLVEYPVAKAYAQKYEDLTISKAKVSNEDAGSAIAVEKDEAELLEVINSALDELIKKDKIDEFVTKANEMID